MQLVAGNKQLAARNMMLVARNKLRVARNLLRATSCAGVTRHKAHFGLPWVRPWDNRGKCYMDEKRIQ